MPRFDMLKVGVLGIDQETRGDRERRAFRLIGQPAEAERTADPHRPAEDLGRKLDQADKLRGAAAQHDSRLGFRRKGRIRKPVPDHFKNLLGAMPYNVGDRGAGYNLGSFPLVVAGGRHGHQLTRVGPAGQHGAI